VVLNHNNQKDFQTQLRSTIRPIPRNWTKKLFFKICKFSGVIFSQIDCWLYNGRCLQDVYLMLGIHNKWKSVHFGDEILKIFPDLTKCVYSCCTYFSTQARDQLTRVFLHWQRHCVPCQIINGPHQLSLVCVFIFRYLLGILKLWNCEMCVYCSVNEGKA
jgi:hypothetical protein